MFVKEKMMRKWWSAVLLVGFGWIVGGSEPWSFEITGDRMRGAGSAVRWEGQPVVVTAAHVVVDNPDLHLADGEGKEYAIRSVELAPDRDLAILETVELPPFGPAVRRSGLGSGASLYNKGISYQPVKISLQEVNLAGLRIRPGESGEAVTGASGEVVGVLRGRRREGEEAVAVRIDNYVRRPEATVTLRQLKAWQSASERAKELDRLLQEAAQESAGKKLRERAAAVLQGFFPATSEVPIALQRAYRETLEPLCMEAAWLGVGLDGTILAESGEYHRKAWEALLRQHGFPDFEFVKPDTWGIACWKLSGKRLLWVSFCEKGPFAGKIMLKIHEKRTKRP